MFNRLTLSTQALILVALPLFFELCFAAILIANSLALESAVEEDTRIRLATRAGWSCCYDVSQMFATFRKTEESHPWSSAGRLLHILRCQLPADIQRASKLASGDAIDEQLLKHLNRDVQGLVQIDEKLRHNFTSYYDPAEAQFLFGRAFYAQIKSYLDDMATACEQDLQGSTANLEDTLKQRLTLMQTGENAVRIAFPACLLLSVGLAIGFQCNAINRLRAVAEKAHRLAAGRELTPPLVGHDEIALLDQNFLTMAVAIRDARKKELSLLRNAADVLITLNRQGKICSISPSCIRVLGCAPEDLIHSAIEKLLIGDALERMLSMPAGATGQSFKFVVRRPNKIAIDVAVSASCSENEIFCVLRDVTAQTARERFKQELVSMVSHDLRSPLTGILAFNEMIAEGTFISLSDTGHRELAICSRRISTMLDLASDLLDIDKIEGGSLTLSVETFDILGLVNEVVADLAAMKAEIDIVSAELHAPMLSADRRRIKQVLSKLLANSIARSPDGAAIVITLSSHHTFLEVSFADAGPGIAPTRLPGIFDEFQASSQADQSMLSMEMGLSVAKALVELHHGTVCCQSDGIVGAKFQVHLPLPQSELDQCQ